MFALKQFQVNHVLKRTEYIYKFNVGAKFLKDASKQQTGSEKK